MSLKPGAQVGIAIGASVAMIGCSFLITRLCPNNSQVPNTFKEPAFQPPNVTFSVVWPIMYTIMAVSLALYSAQVHVSGKRKYAIGALILFLIQLVLNFAWMPVFRCEKKPKEAMYILLSILAVTIATMMVGLKASTVGTALLSPYAAWLIFALMLNAQGIITPSPAGAVNGP